MAKIAPFHSKKETDRKVYHNNDKCTEGNTSPGVPIGTPPGLQMTCMSCSQEFVTNA